MIAAIKGQQILIREIESRRVLSSASWNESIVWGIYEHLHSRNFKKKHYCFYIVHTLGVALLEHDGRYGDLKVTQRSLFEDMTSSIGAVQQTASLVDFEQTKIWSCYSGQKYNYLLAIKDDKLFRYQISDSDDRYLNSRVLYDTHSAFVTVKVV
jgi:hypothetical protein